MTAETAQYEVIGATGDRRRIPRYSCSGQVQITALPLSGGVLRGRLRDLGLGGCCIEGIETVSPFDLGDRIEMLVEVNSWFFRATGRVRAVRERSGISMEFMRMSAGGYGRLEDLIADIERTRPAARRQELLVERPRRLSARKKSSAIVGTIVPAESADTSRDAWVRDSYPAATSLDIFV
jgi:hypothetical protein